MGWQQAFGVSLSRLLAIIALSSWHFSSMAAQSPNTSAGSRVAFVDPIIRLSPNAIRDERIVTITVERPVPQQLPSDTKPELKDVSPESVAGHVTFEFRKAERLSDSALLFSFIASIDSLPPNVTQQRTAQFTDATGSRSLPYTVSNQSVGATTWVILGPPDPWILVGGPTYHAAQLSFITGDAPITNLKIVQSGLVEQATKKWLGPDRLMLCRTNCESDCRNEQIDVGIRTVQPVTLCVADDSVSYGNYRGVVSFAATDKPDPHPLSLNIYSSAPVAKVAGAVLICFGVLLAWIVKVYASNRLARDQDLLPFSILSRRAALLASELDRAPAALSGCTPNIADAIQEILQDLTIANLDAHHFIHPSQPSPFNSFTIDTFGYKAFLQERDTRLNLLSTLVLDGIKPAWDAASKGAPGPAARDALKKIDGLYGQAPAVSDDQARTAIGQILTVLRAAIVTAALGAPAPQFQVGIPSSYDRLLVEISSLSVLVWAVAGLLTALAGIVVLILNNPGFGLPTDYIFCVFWGFSIPTAIQQLTAGSVTTAVGISVPKS